MGINKHSKSRFVPAASNSKSEKKSNVAGNSQVSAGFLAERVKKLEARKGLAGVLLFILALALRLPFLGRAELWCDEILFVWFSSPPMTPFEVIARQWNQFLVVTHLPMPEVAQNLFLWLFYPLLKSAGEHAVLHRLPAVLWGALTVPVFYAMARRLFKPAVSFAAAAMFLLFFFPIYYSREAYFYAPLMFCSAAALYFLLPAIDGEPPGWRRQLGLALAGCGMAYSHLTGIVFAAILFFALLLKIAWLYLRRRNVPPALKSLVLPLFSPLLAVSPFLLRLAFNRVESAVAPGVSIERILLNTLGSLFLGNWLPLKAVALVVFAAGLASLALPGEHAAARRFLAGAAAAAMLFLAFGAYKTQYNARYFSVLAPAAYLIFASGLHLLSQAVAGRWRERVFAAAVGLAAAVTLVFYLPPYYLLEAKSVDFGAIARWLNSNLPPGTPYLMESAYELRFVGGYHPTPGLVGAAPYVHGAGPEEMQRLHEKQRAFMLRFPEAPFIESAHHNAATPEGVWDWPHRHFRQHIRLSNDRLRRLVEIGIYPADAQEGLTEFMYRTDIYFDAWQDRVEKARAAGVPVLFSFEGWQISGHRLNDRETFYFRVMPAPCGSFRLHNISDASLEGYVALQCAVAGEAAGEATVEFSLNGRSCAKNRAEIGRLFEALVPADGLPPGPHELGFRLTGGTAAAQGFIVTDAQWRPAEKMRE